MSSLSCALTAEEKMEGVLCLACGEGMEDTYQTPSQLSIRKRSASSSVHELISGSAVTYGFTPMSPMARVT